MKNLLLLTLFGYLLVSPWHSAQAQKLNLPNPAEFKTDMMGALIPSDDLGLDASQKKALKKQNESFLDNVIGIAKGEGSDTDKLSAIKGLSGQRKGDLNAIFDDKTLKEYKKKVKKQIKPFTRKYKLAKLIL